MYKLEQNLGAGHYYWEGYQEKILHKIRGGYWMFYVYHNTMYCTMHKEVLRYVSQYIV